MSEKIAWAIKVVIEATPEQADKAADAIAAALCADHDHPGDCQVPWTTVLCKLDDSTPKSKPPGRRALRKIDSGPGRRGRRGSDRSSRKSISIAVSATPHS